MIGHTKPDLCGVNALDQGAPRRPLCLGTQLIATPKGGEMLGSANQRCPDSLTGHVFERPKAPC